MTSGWSWIWSPESEDFCERSESRGSAISRVQWEVGFWGELGWCKVRAEECLSCLQLHHTAFHFFPRDQRQSFVDGTTDDPVLLFSVFSGVTRDQPS